jgi:hypothetical protein
MTRVQYKNWKSEIAWLRKLSARITNAYFMCRDRDSAEEFRHIAELVTKRADDLYKAKGAVQQ